MLSPEASLLEQSRQAHAFHPFQPLAPNFNQQHPWEQVHVLSLLLSLFNTNVLKWEAGFQYGCAYSMLTVEIPLSSGRWADTHKISKPDAVERKISPVLQGCWILSAQSKLQRLHSRGHWWSSFCCPWGRASQNVIGSNAGSRFKGLCRKRKGSSPDVSESKAGMYQEALIALFNREILTVHLLS